MVAALCADILARTLERCSVKTEILGFTTKAWKGGMSREDWGKVGKPPSPGRLSLTSSHLASLASGWLRGGVLWVEVAPRIFRFFR